MAESLSAQTESAAEHQPNPPVICRSERLLVQIPSRAARTSNRDACDLSRTPGLIPTWTVAFQLGSVVSDVTSFTDFERKLDLVKKPLVQLAARKPRYSRQAQMRSKINQLNGQREPRPGQQAQHLRATFWRNQKETVRKIIENDLGSQRCEIGSREIESRFRGVSAARTGPWPPFVDGTRLRSSAPAGDSTTEPRSLRWR